MAVWGIYADEDELVKINQLVINRLNSHADLSTFPRSLSTNYPHKPSFYSHPIAQVGPVTQYTTQNSPVEKIYNAFFRLKVGKSVILC